jgi:hypothetical protein
VGWGARLRVNRFKESGETIRVIAHVGQPALTLQAGSRGCRRKRAAAWLVVARPLSK